MSKFLILLLFLTAFEGRAVSTKLTFTTDYLLKDSVIKEEKKHSPKKATIYSMVLPGLGQAYNHKYWKIPVIYAALGISAYYIHINKDSMSKRQDALKLMLDNDTNTIAAGWYSSKGVDQLRAERNRYRMLRDYSIIACAGFYLINIIDAAVDAHFYQFNIDRPLAQQKRKNWNMYSTRVGNTPAIGFCWRF